MTNFFSENLKKEGEITFFNINGDIYQCKNINISNLKKEDFKKAINSEILIKKETLSQNDSMIKSSLINIIRENKTFDDVLIECQKYWNIKELKEGKKEVDIEMASVLIQSSFKIGDIKIFYTHIYPIGDYGENKIEWEINLTFYQ